MALTLVEASKKYSADVIRQATIEMFARQSEILAALPFETIPGGAVKYTQEGVLPGVAFRGVNESYTESTGILNPMVDAVAIIGGDIDVDKFIVATQGQGARAQQTSMKIKAIADAWAQKLIKGDSSSDPREFDGLQVRLTGAQKIAAGSTANGSALSLAKLDELIDAVDMPTHLIMSKAMRIIMMELGLWNTGEPSTVNFGGLNALEVRAQCSMIRAAVRDRLPAPEAWAVQARYGINEITLADGRRKPAACRRNAS